MTKICPLCGRGSWNRRKEPQLAICKECGAEFTYIREGTRFCSPQCSSRWGNRDMRRRLKEEGGPAYAEYKRKERHWSKKSYWKKRGVDIGDIPEVEVR